MEFWTFSYNMPAVFVYFMYLIIVAAVVVVVVFGMLAVKHVKIMEAAMPANADYEAAKADREAAKAAKKGAKKSA